MVDEKKRMSEDATGYLFVGMLAGIGVYAAGIGQYRLKKLIEYTPTSKAIAVAPGMTEISGVIRPSGKTFNSPFEKKECLYYRTLVYRWSGAGKNRSRSLVKVLESTEPFNMEDDTGKVLILPDIEGGTEGVLGDAINLAGGIGSSYRDVTNLDKKYSGMPSREFVGKGFFGKLFSGSSGNEKLAEFLSENVPSLKEYGDTVDVEEKYFVDGDRMYVLGTAKEVERDGKPRMMVTREKKNAFCIADGSEKDALSSVSLFAYLALVGGPLLFALSTGLILVRFEMLSEFTVELVVLAVAIMYAYVASIHVLEIYNGTVRLKNNIERAKANVDALLTRRHDLISNLVEAVSAYSKYERNIMDAVSRARAAAVEGDAKQIFAIAENYPRLRANENYQALSSELANTENWIAGSRKFVMDSIVLYNQRVQSFPYVLFAPYVGMKQIAFESQ